MFTRTAVWKWGTLLGVSFFLSCTDDSAEDKEQAALSQAITQQEEALLEEPPPKPQSDVPIGVVFDFDNMSLLMQSYFTDDAAVKALTDALRYDPIPLTSPVMVRVRWITEEGTRGVGEVAIVYDRPIAKLTEAQAAANALIRYRDYVGGAFDLRLLSFDLFLEGQGHKGCRLPILNPIGVTEAVISPCLELGGEKICAKDSGAWTSALKAGLTKCFIP